MSLTTAGIHCTISQRLSGAMEDCSTVRVQQPRTLCRQRCCYVRVTTHVRLAVERSYAELKGSLTYQRGGGNVHKLFHSVHPVGQCCIGLRWCANVL